MLVAAGCASSGTSGAPAVTTTPAPTSGSVARATAVASTSTTTTVARNAAPQRNEPALPVAVQEAAGAVAGGKLYVVGGYDTARNSTNGVYVFDGTSWTRGPSLPIALNHPGAATLGDAVYVAGGFTPNGASNRAFVLRAGSSRWAEVAPMQRARGALALLSLAGRLYAIGGRDGSVQVAVPEVYDSGADRWHDAAAMPNPRNHVAGYVDGTVACVAGGRTPDTSAAIDCFDPATSMWAQRATVPAGTSGAAAAVVDGVTIVAGGEAANETHLVDRVEMLTGTAWRGIPMMVPRHGPAFAVFHGRLWACGGATAPGFQAVATCTSIAP